MLVFPTFYPGEGFPTTIVESFMAGLPVVASNWRFNSELVQEGKTGFIVRAHDINQLSDTLRYCLANEEVIRKMKSNVINRSFDYEPQKVVEQLVDKRKKNIINIIAIDSRVLEIRNHMKKIGIIGYFGYSVDNPIIGGQMSKTIGIYNELVKVFGEDNILRVDTSNWKGDKHRLLINIIKIAVKCNPILILPNKNGIKIILPIISFLKRFYGYSIAYPVAGGWLPSVLNDNKYLIKPLNKIDYVLPETKVLMKELEDFYNGRMDVMPIFSQRKPLYIQDSGGIREQNKVLDWIRFGIENNDGLQRNNNVFCTFFEYYQKKG